MRYVLGIPVVNRQDLLRLAVQSVQPLWPHTLIIDNSESGLDASGWQVPIVRPSVPLTFSQSMNLLQRLALERSCDFFLCMHNDAEAGAGTPERLLAVIQDVTASGWRWGVAFTYYHALAAFSMAMVGEVGPWDTALPHYFADNDYYFRVRLAGYEIIDTGLPVRHHNDASSTIKSNPILGFLNGVTFPLYARYYATKWGGPPEGERYDRPFDGAPSRSFVKFLHGQELYRQLANSYETLEGNLLEPADERTNESQIEALRYAVALTHPQTILETGTAKSMFGYALSHMVDGVTLYTFDSDPRCAVGVELFNAAQANVKAVFTLGDTKQTLPMFDVHGIGFAWIDGGHDEATTLSDIQQAMRLAIPMIAIDDTRTMPEVARAVDRALQAHSAYERQANPFYVHDARGIVYLRRRQA